MSITITSTVMSTVPRMATAVVDEIIPGVR
jgi:hypothetical protein